MPIQPMASGLRLSIEGQATDARDTLVHLWEAGHPAISLVDNHLHVPAQQLWALNDAELDQLGVSRFLGHVELRETGNAGSPRYRWGIQWPGLDPIVEGCWYRAHPGDTPRLLGPAAHTLIAQASAVTGADQATVFRAFRRLKHAIARSPQEQVKLPRRMAERTIRVADSLQIEVDASDDGHSRRPVPLLVDRHNDLRSEEPPGPDRTDWVLADDWSVPPPQDEAFQPDMNRMLHNWVARVMKGDEAEHAIQIGQKEWVLVPAKVLQNYVMTAAAAHSSQPAASVDQFLDNPTAFLPHDDAFDTAHYAARVVGIGEAPRSPPPSSTEARDWTGGHDGGLQLLTPSGPIHLSSEQLDPFRSALEQAQTEGHPHVHWDGVQVPVIPAVIDAVARAASGQNRSHTESADDKSQPTILLIHENTLEVEWAPVESGGRRVTHTALPTFVPGFRLRSHQESSLARFRNLWSQGRRGALLCDDMGLGKTLQALTFGAWVGTQYATGGGPPGARRPDIPVVLVAPPSLLEGWLKELETRFPPNVLPRVLWGSATLPSLRPKRSLIRLRDFVRKSDRDARSAAVLEHARLDLNALRALSPDVLLVGYQTLRKLQFALGKARIGIIIADEVQAIKNNSSLQSRALRAMDYDFGLALTGTPIENAWTDLWTICDFAVPGRLGALTEFRKAYSAASSADEVRNSGERLSQRLEEVFIRRTRRDALDGLPPLSEQSIERAMPPAQEQAYRAELAARGASRGSTLKLLQGLARVSLHPRLRATLSTPSEAVAWMKESARTAVALDHLHQWAAEGHAVLVFVRSLAMQATLARAVQLCFPTAPPVEVLNGQASFAQRRRAVERVEQGNGFRVLLVSPDVGGAGWNLQFACRSILLQRPFNPAVEAQMVARTWRLGQTRAVQAVAPVATLPDMRSFDEVLAGLLDEKKSLAASVLCPAEVSAAERDQRFEELWAGV